MIVNIVLRLALLLLLAPLLPGIIARTKAVFAGRRGAPLLQSYWDLGRLWRKGLVISRTTTWIFWAGPVVAVAVPVVASLLLPMGALQAPLSFEGDVILFVYLFALMRFFTAVAALDTGSSFEGMGAAREVTFSCLAEPTLLLGFVVLARMADGLSLNAMLGTHLVSSWSTSGASLALIVVCLMVVLLVENSRLPFDDPNTHLELTMIHEVMVLDHSGPLLGLILYGSALKLMVLGAIIVRLLLPVDTGNIWLDAAVFMGGQFVLAVAIGTAESVMARLRLSRVPQVLIGTTLVAIFAVVLVLR
jgi:formate hydrogenlyase subunit 4